MLLAIDVGNSQTVAGLFAGSELKADWRVTTRAAQTGDELAVLVRALLASAGVAVGEIRGVAVSSVVPALTPEYRRVGERLFGRAAFVIDHRTVPDLRVAVPDPASVGADRLVNAIAARETYGAPVIVVDLGTATTFDVVDARGDYVGGAIAPGVGTAADALFQRGARLAKVEVRRPDRVVGRTTEESLQSGIYYSAVGGVDALVRRIIDEMGFPAGVPVVATGGLAAMAAASSTSITAVDEHLTLRGIRLVWERVETG